MGYFEGLLCKTIGPMHRQLSNKMPVPESRYDPFNKNKILAFGAHRMRMKNSNSLKHELIEDMMLACIQENIQTGAQLRRFIRTGKTKKPDVVMPQTSDLKKKKKSKKTDV